ncbi:hypothetical protein [uncultured Paraglaciecola sp.]|uniref:hypothetical protein n=1 Tax=uncultured Paraglaciecola sp. TaxID=1765024 RepID=UPI00261FD753|nr:hypothetical protein [uncultured Paraglaciecola sp.]
MFARSFDVIGSDHQRGAVLHNDGAAHPVVIIHPSFDVLAGGKLGAGRGRERVDAQANGDGRGTGVIDYRAVRLWNSVTGSGSFHFQISVITW